MSKSHNKPQHSDNNIAYHLEWRFKKESLVWYGTTPVAINFHTIGTEFKDWLLRKSHFSILSKSDKSSVEAITNPYSYNASAIAAILARAINAAHEFASSVEKIDKMEAEIERIRLYNEQVLYAARICEVTIKQLLYCTLIPPRSYAKSALAGLLSYDCKPCRKAGKPHKISLLGSLAHSYLLCVPFEHCLFEHLKIVNRRRNVEAAHSGTQTLDIRSPQESRDQLMQDSNAVLKELVHMLEHISDLEQAMKKNLLALIKIPYENWI